MKKIRYFQVGNWRDVVGVDEEYAGRWLAENVNACPKAITEDQYDIFMAGYHQGYRDGVKGE